MIRQKAQPVHRVEVWNGANAAMSLKLDVDPDPNQRLFCLPQNETEAILAEKLAEHGVTVEYEAALEVIREDGGRYATARVNGEDGRYAFILGADGTRSTVRQYLGEEMRGYDLPSKWSIADIDAHNWTEPGVFRVYLKDDGNAACPSDCGGGEDGCGREEASPHGRVCCPPVGGPGPVVPGPASGGCGSVWLDSAAHGGRPSI